MSRAHELIQWALDQRGMRMRHLSITMGEIQQILSQQMRVQQDLKFERVEDLLSALGYEIKIVDRGYRIVSDKFLDAVTVTPDKAPFALYVGKCGDAGKWAAVDNRDGLGTRIEFTDKESLDKWLVYAAVKKEV